VPDDEEIAVAIQDGLDDKLPSPPPDFRFQWDWNEASDVAITALKNFGVI
jgi:hypothetical protein